MVPLADASGEIAAVCFLPEAAVNPPGGATAGSPYESRNVV